MEHEIGIIWTRTCTAMFRRSSYSFQVKSYKLQKRSFFLILDFPEEKLRSQYSLITSYVIFFVGGSAGVHLCG